LREEKFGRKTTQIIAIAFSEPKATKKHLVSEN